MKVRGPDDTWMCIRVFTGLVGASVKACVCELVRAGMLVRACVDAHTPTPEQENES